MRDYRSIAYLITLGLLFLEVLLSGSCSKGEADQRHQVQPSQPVPSTAQRSAKLAVLVGINDYPYVYPPLHGTLNDVETMKTLLTSQNYGYGFQEGNVHTLKQDQATRGNILKEIDDYLIKQAVAGSVIVFYFSGHGSTWKDPDDPMGYDNTIVPYDSRDPGRNSWDIRDKELNLRVRELSDRVGPKGNVTFILDSCHSGTGVRAAGTPKAAKEDTRFQGKLPPLSVPPRRTNPARNGSGTFDRDASGSGFADTDSGINYVLIAGSRTDQSSFEMNDSTHGELTFYLAKQLMVPSSGPRTYRDVLNRVIPDVLADRPEQRPQLEGNKLDQIVFGNETAITGAYILANPAGTNRVELDGGRLLGFTKGSIFDVYGPTARLLHDPEKPILSVRIDDVQEFESSGTILNSQGHIPAQSKAVEREHNFEAEKVRVLFDSLSGSASLQKIKARIEQNPRHPFEVEGEGQSFLFRISDDHGTIRTFGPDGAELSAGVPTDTPDLADLIEARLTGWARWFGLIRLHNPVSPRLATLKILPTGDASLPPPGKLIGFTPGKSRFDLQIRNESQTDKVFVYILDLTSDGRSRLVFPTNNATVPLDPSQTIPITGWNVSLPKGSNYVRDIFKLIVTGKEVDLQSLQMDAPKGADERSDAPIDPLNRLLSDAMIGARNGDRSVAENWSSDEVSYEVCETLKSGRCR